MKKRETNLDGHIRKSTLTDSEIKRRKLELAKLWGRNFWEGDLDQMRTNIDIY